MKHASLSLYLAASLCSPALQAEDLVPDLPDSAQDSLSPAAAPLLGRFSLELKGQGIADWRKHDSGVASGRVSARLTGAQELTEASGIEVDTRLRSQVNSRESYQIEQDSRLDVQSLAFTWSAIPSWRWIAGRTNIRNGVASGFNPTDWFKENSQVIIESLDTADRREDRLGVVAIEGVWLTAQSILSFGYRPDLHAKPQTAAGNAEVVGLGLDRTNNQDALFVKYAPSPASWDNVSLTLSSLYLRNRPGLGAELSMAMSDNVVLYSEWFGQQRQSLADEAMTPDRDNQRWYNQLALGGTWSAPEVMVNDEDVAVSLEYHFNEAGLKQHQLDAWSKAIRSGNPQAGSIAALANVKQEPLATHQAFTRLAWNDFWADNDLSLITTVTPMDGSGFTQLALSIPATTELRLDLKGYHYFGATDTLYGSSGYKDGVMISFIYTL